MNNTPCKNIVNYWNAVERFTPHHLDTKNKLLNSKIKLNMRDEKYEILKL